MPFYMLQESSKRHVKPGETRAGKEHKVYIDAEGRQRHVMTLDDKLVRSQTPRPRHKGLSGSGEVLEKGICAAPCITLWDAVLFLRA